MDKVTDIINHAEQKCINKGSRLTAKRKQVLSALIQSQKALSAYDLIDLCEQMFGNKIPAMSIYRILEFLENENLVHKLNLANKYVACSHITCEHRHETSQLILCSVCDQVEEIPLNNSITNQLQANVTNAGFQLIKSHFEMNCICHSCLSKII